MSEIEAIPFENVTAASLVHLFAMHGFKGHSDSGDMIQLPGPGALAAFRISAPPRLALTGGFRFTRRSGVIDRMRFANHMSSQIGAARCYVDGDHLICVHDILCTSGMLPSHVIYAYKYFRGAMNLVDKLGQDLKHW